MSDHYPGLVSIKLSRSHRHKFATARSSPHLSINLLFLAFRILMSCRLKCFTCKVFCYNFFNFQIYCISYLQLGCRLVWPWVLLLPEGNLLHILRHFARLADLTVGAVDLTGHCDGLDLVVHGETLQHRLHGTAISLPHHLLHLGLRPLLPGPGLSLLCDDTHEVCLEQGEDTDWGDGQTWGRAEASSTPIILQHKWAAQ